MWNVQSFQSGEGPSRRPRALCFSKAKGSAWSVNILVPLHPSKTQQYDCKWYIPLTDLNFQMVDELEAVPNIPLVPDEELDALKIKISQIKSDIQREKVRPIFGELVPGSVEPEYRPSKCSQSWPGICPSTAGPQDLWAPLRVLGSRASDHSWSLVVLRASN